jgi:aminoglycoside phosphotransferase (APT) family kinase protein
VQSPGETELLRPIVGQFSAESVVQIEPLGNGHIHQTYLVRLTGGASRQLVLQRVNTHVFSNLDAVMQNIVRVTSHVRARLEREGARELDRRILSLRFTRAGKTHHVDSVLGTYRMFGYVDGSVTLERLEAPEQGLEAGRICGELARLLDDLPPALLHTTLPDFHATDKRFDALRDAVAADARGRVEQVRSEWEQLQSLEPLARECAAWSSDPALRLRITHNDTKLDNVLFDAATQRGLCLIDLDTVMPGYLAYDFGDLVRSCLCTAAEDARDPTQVQLRLELFEPIARGYLGELPALSALERRSLARGPLWIVLELALRFLSDYVQGDVYFKIAHPEHNLDRARVMLALLDRFLAHEDELQRVIEACAVSQT